MPGVTTVPPESSSAPVSAMPVTPTPTTRPEGARAMAPEPAATASSNSCSGSISAPPSTVRQETGARSWDSSRPSAETTAALHQVVPTSIPSSSPVMAHRPPGDGSAGR